LLFKNFIDIHLIFLLKNDGTTCKVVTTLFYRVEFEIEDEINNVTGDSLTGPRRLVQGDF
jgi:hypothetical protein